MVECNSKLDAFWFSFSQRTPVSLAVTTKFLLTSQSGIADFGSRRHCSPITVLLAACLPPVGQHLRRPLRRRLSEAKDHDRLPLLAVRRDDVRKSVSQSAPSHVPQIDAGSLLSTQILHSKIVCSSPFNGDNIFLQPHWPKLLPKHFSCCRQTLHPTTLAQP